MEWEINQTSTKPVTINRLVSKKAGPWVANLFNFIQQHEAENKENIYAILECA
jgi:hypothetical protein